MPTFPFPVSINHSSGRYSRGRGRDIGWPYQEIIEIGPSYIPSPVHTHPHTHTHAHTHAWYTRVRECVGSACVMWVCMGVVGSWKENNAQDPSPLSLPPYQPVFPPGGIVGEGLGCRYLGSQPFPSPPHKIFSRGGDGGCGRVLVVGNKVPRPFHTHTRS